MAYKVAQIRRDIAANWTSNNPTLAEGEWGYETDTGQIKIGDGSTAWASLGYSGGIVGAYSFGSCTYDDEDIPWELTDIEENVWYSISPPSAISGDLNEVTHDGFGKLTITKAGKYYISWVLSLPYEGGLDYGQFEGARLENCVETAVKVGGELITQNQDGILLNSTISNDCIVDVEANDVVDINIRAIVATISTIVMDLMYLEVIEITPGLRHHFPSVFIE